MNAFTPPRSKPKEIPVGYSKKQTAEVLGVSVKTVERYVNDGRLTAHRVGPRFVRITEESLLRMLGVT